MHLLLRLALAVCPSDFRREYRDAIAQDVRSRGLSAAAAAADVLWQGTLMRLENFWRDVVLGARSLAKAPVFAGVAIVTIALAIGVNVAAFSILKGVLLDPLPYAHADRLVAISEVRQREEQTNIDFPDARDLGRRSTTLAGISVETNAQGALTGMGKPVELHGWYVSGDYFNVLDVKPQLGRFIAPSDVGRRNIVISNELWRSRFGGSPAILGRRVTIDDRVYTIVGVAPPHLLNPGPGFMISADYWVPIDPHAGGADWRGNYAFWSIASLRPGVSVAQARSDLSRVMAGLASEYPNFDRGYGVRVQSLYDALVGPMRMMVLMLYGAAMLVLLIAAANIGNLLLARAAARERDLVVRSALGATRTRLALTLIAETSIVSFAGLVAGIALSAVLLRAIDGYLATFGQAYGMNMIVPGWNRVAIDLPVLCYGLAVTLLFTMLTAVLPAYTFNPAARVGKFARRARLGAALAVCEIVLAFAVLSMAGLLLHGFLELERTPVGFSEANTYAVQIDLPASRRYAGNDAVLHFYARAVQAIRALPGVAAASEAHVVGLGSSSGTNYSFTHPIGENGVGEQNNVEFNSVSPQFFATLGIPLLAGRLFTSSDAAHSEPVAIVSKSFAAQHFGGTLGALGRFVSVGESSGGGFPLRRIVGVAGDVRHSLSDAPAPEVYVPFSQVTFPGALVVRTRGSDPHLRNDIAGAITRIDPLLPAPQIMSFALLHSLDDAVTRISTGVFFGLAAAALLLALAGIYGVVAYNVERRTHEFGIRMSLGARASGIALRVLREAVVLAVIGIAIGTVLAALAARAMGQLLYETSPLDAGTYLAAAALLLAAVTISALVPAIRAMRVEPAAALRYE